MTDDEPRTITLDSRARDVIEDEDIGAAPEAKPLAPGGEARRRDPDVLLDERQVSKNTNVPVRTLQMWRHRCEGPPFIKLGALVRYRQGDLDDWLASRTVTPKRGRR